MSPKTLLKADILALIFLALALVIFFWAKSDGHTMVVKNQKIKIELALTAEQKELGLGGRQALPDDQGMLFIYEGYGRPGFWMKGMKFPLDIIWIRDDRVFDISQNLMPVAENEQLQVYKPRENINLVLEVNAGFVDKYGIKIGDKVTMPKSK